MNVYCYFYWSERFNGWRAKIFINLCKIGHALWAESIFVGPPSKKIQLSYIACKYLLFITACLENGIRKKLHLIFLLIITWFGFSTAVQPKSDCNLGMNQDMEILRSSHVLGRFHQWRWNQMLNKKNLESLPVISSLRGNDQSGRAPGMRSWVAAAITLRRDTLFKEVTESAFLQKHVNLTIHLISNEVWRWWPYKKQRQFQQIWENPSFRLQTSQMFL